MLGGGGGGRRGGGGGGPGGVHWGLPVVLVTAGVANRVLNKLALVPLTADGHVFFLAQFMGMCYVVVYSTLLAWRAHRGLVPRAQLRYPLRPFAVIGGLEAVSLLTMLTAAARLEGALLPMLSQTFLVWQLALAVLRGKRFSGGQVGGVLLVAGGLALAVAPGAAGSLLTPEQAPFAALYVLSMLFPALASTQKEVLFAEARRRLGRPLDLFVVNSYGSAFQAAFTALLLPAMMWSQGSGLSQLGRYLWDGICCFTGACPAAAAAGAPWFQFSYVAVNLFFNVAALRLLQVSNAVTTSVVATLVVPLAIVAFALLPLPFLSPPALSWRFWVGSSILVLGQALYTLSRGREAPPEGDALAAKDPS